jgi:hypothetical protein
LPNNPHPIFFLFSSELQGPTAAAADEEQQRRIHQERQQREEKLQDEARKKQRKKEEEAERKRQRQADEDKIKSRHGKQVRRWGEITRGCGKQVLVDLRLNLEGVWETGWGGR